MPSSGKKRKVAVVKFPGSNCDLDGYKALKALGLGAELVWHTELPGRTGDFTGIFLPGGFSYGDHLRAGVIAAFSPSLKAIRDFAKKGGRVLGVCNGFQILVESGLLPGALARNDTNTFICKWVGLELMENVSFLSPSTLPVTRNPKLISLPIANGEGKYMADEKTLERLKENKQIVFTYSSNPNGSALSIAGICNEAGNVVGMMPHPERAITPELGGTDGKEILLRAFKL